MAHGACAKPSGETLARELLRHEIPYFLPLMARPSWREEESEPRTSPSFKVCILPRGSQARDRVISSGVGVSILEVEDQPLLHSELEQLRRLQLAGASLIPVQELSPAKSSGSPTAPSPATQGWRRTGRGDRLIVQISLLRKTVGIEFESGVLRRPRRV